MGGVEAIIGEGYVNSFAGKNCERERCKKEAPILRTPGEKHVPAETKQL